MKVPSKKKRLEGGGRKAALSKIEEVLAWIEGCRAKNFGITRVSVRKKAADLAQAQDSLLSLLKSCKRYYKVLFNIIKVDKKY